MLTPLVFLLVFGVFEMGLGFRTYLGVSAGTNDAGRAASTFANQPDADFRMLATLERSMEAVPDDLIRHIVVFNPGAAGAQGTPTAGCQSGIPSSAPGAECNVYTPTHFDQALWAPKFGCSAPDSPDRFWCPTSRDASASSLGFVGVYIAVDHNFVTGMFGDDYIVRDTTVMRIEPRES